jgi:hypothetical protein
MPYGGSSLPTGQTMQYASTRTQETKVEAKVVRPIDRTEGTVLATLRVLGQDDFVKEWPLDELVTLVRGP